MQHTPGLWHIVLVFGLVVTLLAQAVLWPTPVWDPRFGLPRCVRQRYNPRRNRERWARRQAAWARRPRPLWQTARRGVRPQRQRRVCQWAAPRPLVVPAQAGPLKQLDQAPVQPVQPAAGAPAHCQPAAAPADPLAALRAGRGWIDLLAEAQLWAVLMRVRWPPGPRCPRCGETDPQYLKVLDSEYRGGLGRWQCQVCAQAGDAGQAGTFTPLTGTLLEGLRIDVRTLWLILEQFASGRASVETAQEARINRHTTDRFFRLFRAAIYQRGELTPITLGVEDIVEGDEVYITAGLKGHAGGLALDREPRQRGLKRRGRGTWDSDRLPVFGLLCRGGAVRLFVLRNVQTKTIRPLGQQLVQRGAHVYTDGYSIYHFLTRDGYQHRTVNHGAGEYALDLDGDGQCEVHCNTMECTWSWLRPMVRTYRGVSKVYLPLYVAQFEFMYNRRHANRWSRTLDVLQAVLPVDASQVAHLLNCVETAQFAEVCPVAE